MKHVKDYPGTYHAPAALLIGLAVVALAATGCAQTDVVAKFANQSFKATIEASKDYAAYIKEEEAWALASPAGDGVLFSTDFSRNSTSGGMADMDKPDVEFVFDATPFIAAGLDISRLPMEDGIKYEFEDGTFMYHFELGDDKFPATAAASFEATFAEIVKTQRSRIGYHAALDHYGIALGNGNMFEWAKDLTKNDKDIVWVLNPEPFIQAGVDPAKISGWVFAKVETMDSAGKKILVDKLLKPFNLE
jgi:hypothetical protein